MISDQKTQGEWKIQLIIAINSMSFKDSKETCTMHTKGDNIETLIGHETDKIIKELFNSLIQKYQKGLEESMKVSEFIFDSVHLLY